MQLINLLNFSTDKCLDLLCTANKVLSKTMEWMSSSDLSLEARASASLVVANIARNGEFRGCYARGYCHSTCTKFPISIAYQADYLAWCLHCFHMNTQVLTVFSLLKKVLFRF